MTSSGKTALLLASVAILTGGAAVAQVAQSPFSAAQATAGRTAYAANCAACHQPDLTGQGDAPPLVGQGFMLNWSGKTTAELYKLVHDTMPYGMGGSLPDKTYADIVAYILASNGARPGASALSATSSPVRIGALAAGRTAAAQIASAPPATAPTPSAAPRAAAGDSEGGGGRGAQPLGWSVKGHIEAYTDVTDEMLRSPSPSDWLLYRGGYAGWSYSKLDQINDRNVGGLQLVWSYAMVNGATQETTPIIHDGVLFLWNPGNVVQAFDAASGELLWENRLGPMPVGFGGGNGANRTIAVWKDKVYLATHEARLYALNARTGEKVWETEVGVPGAGHQTTAGVIVVNGKVLSGLTACGASGSPVANAKPCYISAYDAETGKRLWKFDTIATHGKPGGDTWNNLPDNKRAGGETWILGTYDPALNTTYWGSAQAKPWRRDMRGSGDGETLYTSSTIALNPDTGELKWHFNHSPGETLDLDEVFERVLIDQPGGRKTLMTVGKPGILWKLDRQTGKFIGSAPTVINNVSKVDPKTGRLRWRDDIVKQKLDDWLPSCPGPQGGHDWQTTSYNPATDTLVVPLSQSCVLMLGNGSQKFYAMPGSDGMLGRLSAFKASTLEPLWTFQQRSSFLSSTLSTAGNLVFIGDFDRTFRAVDGRTGQTLWKTRLGTTVQGHPVTFSVKGKQYVAITAGLGGGSPQQKPMALLPEVTRPMQGNQIYVFALPDGPTGQQQAQASGRNPQ